MNFTRFVLPTLPLKANFLNKTSKPFFHWGVVQQPALHDFILYFTYKFKKCKIQAIKRKVYKVPLEKKEI